MTILFVYLFEIESLINYSLTITRNYRKVVLVYPIIIVQLLVQTTLSLHLFDCSCLTFSEVRASTSDIAGTRTKATDNVITTPKIATVSNVNLFISHFNLSNSFHNHLVGVANVIVPVLLQQAFPPHAFF